MLDIDAYEKLQHLNDLSRHIQEYQGLSTAMKGVSALIVLVDLVCVRQGGWLVSAISVAAAILFFFFDREFSKKRALYESKLSALTAAEKDKTAAPMRSGHPPFVYYAVILVVMILWWIVMA